MKITLAHSKLNDVGGGERFLLEMAKRLGKKHEIEILTTDYQKNKTYPEFSKHKIRIVGKLSWPLMKPKADVILANNFPTNLISFSNKNVVYYVHTMRTGFIGDRKYFVRRKMDKLAVKKCRRIVTNSRFSAGKIEKYYKRKADIVYPGVDPLKYKRGRYGDYALCVSRISPEKGMDRLVKYWKGLKIKLKIVGGGDAKYVRKIKSAAPQEFEFLGVVDDNRLKDLYSNCFCVVFLPHEEDFGIVPLEAMASGKPVIAAKEGGPKETIISGKTGFLIDNEGQFREKITLLYKDRPLCKKLGIAGSKRVENFTWDSTFKAMERILAEVSG